MEINLSDSELIFLYGHLRNQERKLKELKNIKETPINRSDANEEIQLYSKIADKIKEAKPGLSILEKQ